MTNYTTLPIDWDEVPSEWKHLVIRAKAYSNFDSFLRTFIRAYHGTTRDFIRFDVDAPRNDVMIDRYLGIHFAKDKTIAKNFAAGYAGAHHISTHGIGRIIEVFIDAHHPLIVDQRNPFNPKVLLSDQNAIEILAGSVVFPHRKDLFVEIYRIGTPITQEELEREWEKINNGEFPKYFNIPQRLIDFYGGNMWKAFVANYSFTLPFGKDAQRIGFEFAKEFRKRMNLMGYDILVYQNTAPMEIEGAKDTTSYIVWDPWKILYFTDLQKIWAVAHGELPNSPQTPPFEEVSDKADEILVELRATIEDIKEIQTEHRGASHLAPILSYLYSAYNRYAAGDVEKALEYLDNAYWAFERYDFVLRGEIGFEDAMFVRRLLLEIRQKMFEKAREVWK